MTPTLRRFALLSLSLHMLAASSEAAKRILDEASAMTDAGCFAIMLEHVPAERLTLNPDCGFSPSSLNPTDIDEAYLKLKAMCAGAKTPAE